MSNKASKDKIRRIVDEVMALTKEEKISFKRILAILEALEAGDLKSVQVLGTLKFTAYAPEEFAVKIGRPAGTVRRWLREGTLVGKQINRSWMIPHSELERITSPD